MTVTWRAPKDPQDVKWYAVDCTPLLNGAELVTAVFTVPDDLTKEDELVLATSVRVKLSGGTAGTNYILPLLFTTSDGQTFQRDMKLRVKDV